MRYLSYKFLIYLVFLVMFISTNIYAGQFDGKWKNISSKNCYTGTVSQSAYSFLFEDDIVVD